VGLLTVLCFVDTEYALTYHGPKYIAFAIAGNVTLAMISAMLALRFRRCQGTTVGTLFHATLFLWIASYAFPYLGEYP
jgi:hypothetical protein